MLKKAFRSAVSFALVVCLLLGMSGNAIALAANYGGAAPEQNKPIKYVSLGDSMANGYGFAGYNQTSNDRNVYDFMTGKGMYGVGAYPTQFEKYLTDLGYEVDHTKLATSAMLAEDLLYLLGGREEFDDGWGGYKDYVGTYTDAELMPNIQNAITEADVITMGIGNASFGAFLLHKITDALGVFGATLEEDEKVDFEDAIAVLELDAEQYALVMQMHDYLVNMLIGKVPAGLVDQYNLNDVVDLLSYTATTYIVNYKLLVEKILEMNPDVEIILVGLLNTTYGMNITDENGNVLLPFGDVMDELFGILNTYMAGLPAVLQAQGLAEDAKLYYAEQPNPKFICQEFESLLNNNWTADDPRLDGAIIRQRNIDAFNGDLASMIGYAVTGAPLAKITLSDVEAYNGSAWGVGGQNTDKQLAVAIYLAIEEAVARSTNTMDIPLSGLIKIAGDLSSVFTDLGTPPTSSPEASRQWLVDGLSTEETQGMCKIYGLFKVGNGMSVHPTPKGHDEIAASVIAAYENKHTVQDEIIEKAKLALGAVVDLVVEYYDDAYAYAYANSGEYIAAANTAIDAAIAKLEALDLSDSEMTAAFKAELEQEIEEIIEALTAAKALLNGADVLDQETLDLAIAALEEAGEAVANLEKLLAQAGADVTELVIVPAIEAAIEYVEEVAIPAVIEAAENMAAEALNYLLEKLEEAYSILVDAAVEAAKKYAPEVADAIYDYLYNNPEEVIEFVKTYGPYVLELTEEYGDEILGVIGYVLYNYGEDIAALIIENHEAILSGIVAWAEIHGENTIQLIQVYAEALGLCDAVREQMEALKTELEEMIADLEALAAKLEAELDKLYAELEELKAQLENASEELKAEIEAAIAQIEAAIAEIEAAIAEIEAAIAELQAELAQVIAEIKATVEAVEAVFEELNDLAEAIASGVADAIMDAVDAVQAALDNLAKVVEAAEQTIEYINEIIDALQELGADIYEAVEALKNAVENLDDVIAEIVDELEAKLEEVIDELEAKLDEVVEELKAELEAVIEGLKAELEATVEALLNMVEAEVAAALEALVAELEALAEELAAEVVALTEELLAAVEELLNDAAAELVAVLTELFNDATHTDYLITEDSSYVAIGDNAAYAELLADYLAELVAAEKAGYEYTSTILTENGATIADAPAVIQNNLAAIAGADLISIGYGNDTFATEAIDAMMNALLYGTYAEYDWVALLGEDAAVYAAETMAEVYAMLVEQGLADVVIPTAKANLADAMMAAVESYVYNVAVYTLYLPEVVNAIHEINPDAQVIIVGMSNPFAGTVFAYEDMAINVGEYVDYIVDAANIYGVTYAVLAENVTFVPAPEAESSVTNQTIEMSITFVAEYLQGKWSFATTEAGNAYIAEQIENALTITVEPADLLGDADNDGDVDIYDAQMVLAYVTGDPSVKELIELSLSDVDADGDVDVYDAQAILDYVTGGIEKLPAE